MNAPPSDLDATRAAVARLGLVGAASGHLTADVAIHLPFESLGPFKTLLKRYFSTEPWSRADDVALHDLVAAHLGPGWFEHDLGNDITLSHGMRGKEYRLRVKGGAAPSESIFDRAFDGPVLPEATPHPRKVKFTFGGIPADGIWHRRSDEEQPDDMGAKRLLQEDDVTDVMVAGDFVTIGLAGTASWEDRLEPLLALVTEMFVAKTAAEPPERTRDELLREAGALHLAGGSDLLHLLDPNDEAHRARLVAASTDEDPRTRRIAIALLTESEDPTVRADAATTGYADPSRIVRRTAVDAAGDATDPALRSLFERALTDADSWIRWRAAKALGALGAAESRVDLEAVAKDPEFRVRFEVERVLRDLSVSE